MFWVNTLAGAATNFATSNNMLGALTVAVLAFLVWLILWMRRRAREEKPYLEPSHLIVAGVVGSVLCAGVALGGLVWWYYQQPAVGAALNTPVASAPTSTPPSPLKLAKNYFPDEKLKLGNLFTAIRERLNSDGMKASYQGARYGGDILQSKDQIISLVQRVEATRGLLNGIRRYVYDDLIPNNPSYNFEITQLFSNSQDNIPLGKFERELELFHRELTVLRDRYDKVDEETRTIDAYLINRTVIPLQETANAFESWIQRCNDRIDAQRELLR